MSWEYRDEFFPEILNISIVGTNLGIHAELYQVDLVHDCFKQL
jgi:hypothetical protein